MSHSAPNNDGNTVLSAFRITAANPPAIDSANGWDVSRSTGGCGSRFVSSTDGNNNMIVWVVGTEDHQTGGDQRLHGYDGETGAVVYGGGGPNELMAGTHYYSTTGIAAGAGSMSPEIIECMLFMKLSSERHGCRFPTSPKGGDLPLQIQR
jgi:hypothetical protein